MDIETFEHGLDCYGPDLDTWPQAQRAHAHALLRDSQRARTALAQATALEARLSPALAARPIGATLHQRLAQIPATYPARRSTQAPQAAWPHAVWLRRWGWMAGLAASAATVTGFAMGLAGVLGPAAPVDLTALAYGGLL